MDKIILKFFFFYPGTGDTWDTFRDLFINFSEIVQTSDNFNFKKTQKIVSNFRDDELDEKEEKKYVSPFDDDGSYQQILCTYSIGFDGIGADNKVEVRNSPANLKFVNNIQEKYGLDNFTQNKCINCHSFMGTIRQAKGTGMDKLILFTFALIKQAITENIRDGFDIEVKVNFIGFSRGAFTILKLISEEKYKNKLNEISQFHSSLKEFDLFAFLSDPVPGLGNNLNSYRISRYVKKLNIYFALGVKNYLLGARFYPSIHCERMTKYCIYPYPGKHTDLVAELSRNFAHYYSIDASPAGFKRVYYDRLYACTPITGLPQDLRSSENAKSLKYLPPRTSSIRNYTVYIQTKGNRMFLNLREQFDFKNKFPYLYAYMGFEKLFTINSEYEYPLHEIIKNYVDLPYYYSSFLKGLIASLTENFTPNTPYSAKEVYYLKNIAFIYQFDLLYVHGEHNLSNGKDYEFISQDGVLKLQSLAKPALGQVDLEEFIRVFKLSISCNLRNFRANPAKSGNSMKGLPQVISEINNIISSNTYSLYQKYSGILQSIRVYVLNNKKLSSLFFHNFCYYFHNYLEDKN